jgi:hypothetical protein
MARVHQSTPVVRNDQHDKRQILMESASGNGSSSSSWADAYARAKELVAQLTLEEVRINSSSRVL